MNVFNSSRLLYFLCTTFSISLILVNFSSCSSPVAGCMDHSATSFDPNAEDDDGSCIYVRDQFIGNYSGSINAINDAFDSEEAVMKIVPKVNTTNGVVVTFSYQYHSALFKVVTEGKPSEGQISINFVDNAAPLRFCGPAGSHPGTGTLHVKANLIFSPDNNSVSAKGVTVRGIYFDYDCTIFNDAEYTRS